MWDLAADLEVACVGQHSCPTLLTLGLPLPLILQLQVWVGHSCPTPLGLGLLLMLMLVLVLLVWVGHSCPTLLTLGLGLPLPLILQLQVWEGHSCQDSPARALEGDPFTELRPRRLDDLHYPSGSIATTLIVSWPVGPSLAFFAKGGIPQTPLPQDPAFRRESTARACIAPRPTRVVIPNRAESPVRNLLLPADRPATHRATTGFRSNMSVPQLLTLVILRQRSSTPQGGELPTKDPCISPTAPITPANA